MFTSFCVAFAMVCQPPFEVTPTELRSMFNEICGYTEVECDKIKVEYRRLPNQISGLAQLYNTGRMEVLLHTKNDGSMSQTRGILVHEIAHLVMFLKEGNKHRTSHGSQFREVCKELAIKSNVSKSYCSK